MPPFAPHIPRLSECTGIDVAGEEDAAPPRWDLTLHFPKTIDMVRAAPLVRVSAKFKVKNSVCEESSATAYGVFDREFDFALTSGGALIQNCALTNCAHSAPCSTQTFAANINEQRSYLMRYFFPPDFADRVITEAPAVVSGAYT